MSTIPYLERLDAPVIGTTYYQNNSDVNDMPNCTKYCHDRADEATGNKQLRLFKDIGINGFPQADKWLEHSNLPVLNEPKLGSICCCSGDGGSFHVLFLERQNSDGSWLISDSRSTSDKLLRNERFWRLVDNVRLEKGKSPNGVPGCGKILGFQEIPINDIRVTRDTNRNQIELIKNAVHCRKGHSLSADILNPGCYLPTGIYNVLETYEEDGYIWCRLTDEYWCAAHSNWSNLYLVKPDSKPSSDSSPVPDSDTSIKEIFDLLLVKVNELQVENESYKTAMKQIADIANNLIK